MKRLLSAAAAALFLSAAAFAQSDTVTPAPGVAAQPETKGADTSTTGSTAQPTTGDLRSSLSATFGSDTAIIDTFVDESGTDRADADFDTRMKALSPAQMQAMKDGCTKAEAEKMTMSEQISARCKTIMAPAQ
jgi:hypothetical protein